MNDMKLQENTRWPVDFSMNLLQPGQRGCSGKQSILNQTSTLEWDDGLLKPAERTKTPDPYDTPDLLELTAEYRCVKQP